MLWGIIILVAVILDQASKYAIVKYVDEVSRIPVIENFFYIVYSRNAGAAWGMFQGGRYFFIAVTIVVSVIMVYMLVKSDSKLLKLSLAFILGGAIGNFIDRVREGSVVDFLDFYFGSYNFPTFNIADSFVVVGTIILAVYMFFFQKDEEKPKLNDL